MNGECPHCGQKFSPQGLAIHVGIKHTPRKPVRIDPERLASAFAAVADEAAWPYPLPPLSMWRLVAGHPALTPEATAPGLCVERGGTEPCTHHAGSGPVHPGPALTGAKPLPALTPEATVPEDEK